MSLQALVRRVRAGEYCLLRYARTGYYQNCHFCSSRTVQAGQYFLGYRNSGVNCTSQNGGDACLEFGEVDVGNHILIFCLALASAHGVTSGEGQPSEWRLNIRVPMMVGAQKTAVQRLLLLGAAWRAQARSLLQQQLEWQMIEACDGLEAVRKRARRALHKPSLYMTHYTRYVGSSGAMWPCQRLSLLPVPRLATAT